MSSHRTPKYRRRHDCVLRIEDLDEGADPGIARKSLRRDRDESHDLDPGWPSLFGALGVQPIPVDILPVFRSPGRADPDLLRRHARGEGSRRDILAGAHGRSGPARANGMNSVKSRGRSTAPASSATTSTTARIPTALSRRSTRWPWHDAVALHAAGHAAPGDGAAVRSGPATTPIALHRHGAARRFPKEASTTSASPRAEVRVYVHAESRRPLAPVVIGGKLRAVILYLDQAQDASGRRGPRLPRT